MIPLLQLADGFGDVDEVVGNTFGVLGKGDILGSGLRFADTQSEALDMIALHLIGQLVNLVLYLVRTPECGHVHFMVRLHGGFVELGDEGVHLVDLLECIVGETHLLLAEAVGVLNDVLRVVADTLQVTDRADGGDEVLVVELAKLAISSPKPGSNCFGDLHQFTFSHEAEEGIPPACRKQPMEDPTSSRCFCSFVENH